VFGILFDVSMTSHDEFCMQNSSWLVTEYLQRFLSSRNISRPRYYLLMLNVQYVHLKSITGEDYVKQISIRRGGNVFWYWIMIFCSGILVSFSAFDEWTQLRSVTFLKMNYLQQPGMLIIILSNYSMFVFRTIFSVYKKQSN